MARIPMVALKRHKYGTTFYDAGDQYEAKHKKDALILAAMKKSVPVIEAPDEMEIVTKVEPEKKTTKKTSSKKTSTKRTTTKKKTTSTKKTTAKKAEGKKVEKKKTEPKKSRTSKTSTKDLKAEDEKPENEKKDRKTGTYERKDLRPEG